MIRQCYSDDEFARFVFVPLSDHPSDAVWKATVLSSMDLLEPTALIGCKKDMSSYYLDLFKEFELLDMKQDGNVNATDIRRKYFGGEDGWSTDLHPKVREYLNDWKNTAYYSDVQKLFIGET